MKRSSRPRREAYSRPKYASTGGRVLLGSVMSRPRSRPCAVLMMRWLICVENSLASTSDVTNIVIINRCKQQVRQVWQSEGDGRRVGTMTMGGRRRLTMFQRPRPPRTDNMASPVVGDDVTSRRQMPWRPPAASGRIKSRIETAGGNDSSPPSQFVNRPNGVIFQLSQTIVVRRRKTREPLPSANCVLARKKPAPRSSSS